MGRLSRSMLSGVLFQRTQQTCWEQWLDVWEELAEHAIVDWKPTNDVDHVRRQRFVNALRDRDAALDADAILHDGGGEADGAGTGGHD